MKKCAKCGVQKSLAAFAKRATAADGLQSYCRACDNRRLKTYYEKHREARCAYGAQHREEGRVCEARYRMTHREEKRISDARRRKAHPELKRKDHRRRRAQERAVSECFTVEMEQFVRMSWGNQCAFCDSTKKLQIDHWQPLSKGHALTMSNAVLLCQSCNNEKRAKPPEDLDNQVLVAAIEQRLVEQAERWEDCERFAF